MNGRRDHTPVIDSANRADLNGSTPVRPAASSLLLDLPKANLNQPTIANVRITSLKVLVLTLLAELESLEHQIDGDEPSALNLQAEVHRFEAALIRGALITTGGRQRRAARLLGTKVTTLNTKIKRYGIDINQPSGDTFLERSRD